MLNNTADLQPISVSTTQAEQKAPRVTYSYYFNMLDKLIPDSNETMGSQNNILAQRYKNFCRQWPKTLRSFEIKIEQKKLSRNTLVDLFYFSAEVEGSISSLHSSPIHEESKRIIKLMLEIVLKKTQKVLQFCSDNKYHVLVACAELRRFREQFDYTLLNKLVDALELNKETYARDQASIGNKDKNVQQVLFEIECCEAQLLVEADINEALNEEIANNIRKIENEAKEITYVFNGFEASAQDYQLLTEKCMELKRLLLPFEKIKSKHTDIMEDYSLLLRESREYYSKKIISPIAASMQYTDSSPYNSDDSDLEEAIEFERSLDSSGSESDDNDDSTVTHRGALPFELRGNNFENEPIKYLDNRSSRASNTQKSQIEEVNKNRYRTMFRNMEEKHVPALHDISNVSKSCSKLPTFKNSKN